MYNLIKWYISNVKNGWLIKLDGRMRQFYVLFHNIPATWAPGHFTKGTKDKLTVIFS